MRNDPPHVRNDLPRGIVTLLFTDVQGSTRLLDELGADRYGELLAEHHRVCRASWAAHGGVEVDTAGDAFFVAFARPSNALAAAEEAQRALAELGLRVRMGVHTGEVTVAETGYVGVEVHRAARIAAAAHGGQVAVSATTAALVDRPLTDLGEHRFKDLGAPERVFQLGEQEFPPLRSLHLSNLPVPATPFLGRERELAEVVALLSEGGPRVVTLTGPGGTGKTRLALQAAAEASDVFPDGVRWVALAALRDPGQVLPAVAVAVGLEHEDEPSVAAALAAHLASRRQLLLLDNAEHLLPGGAGVVAGLVAGAPLARVLVTSRERLRIAGESAYPVPELTHGDAVDLFRARAAAAGADPGAGAAVGELCDRLERLPLALELAAARAALLSPEQLLERLGQRLDVLKGGRDADPRQATLRATIEWSHDLLDEEERRVFRGLGVFVGGCTFEAAEEVLGADLDTLQSLLDKSLIRRRAGHAGERLWMLETIREYAAERLAQAEEHVVRRAHAGWLARLASEAQPALEGGREQQLWLARLSDDLENARAALAWARDVEPTMLLELASHLSLVFWLRGALREGRDWLEVALALDDEKDVARVDGLTAAALLALYQQEPDRATRYAADAVSLGRALGDERSLGRALREVAKAKAELGETAEARVLLAEAAELAKRTDDVWNLSIVLNNLGSISMMSGDFEQAVVECTESWELRRSRGDDWGALLSGFNLGLALNELGRFEEARRRLLECVETSHRLSLSQLLGEALGALATVELGLGDAERAVRLLGSAESVLARSDEMMGPLEIDLLESALARARSALPAPAFARAWEEGIASSADDAVAYALGLDVAPAGDGRPGTPTLDSPGGPARP